MGKGNRNKLRRENDNLVNADTKVKTAKKQAKGVPLWAGNMILGAIGLLLVVVILVTTISSSGIVLKLTKYASSSSYQLNGAQMTYIFKTLYNNFAEQYSSYLSYILDTNKSLKDQDSIYTDEDGNKITWFEYFALQTEAEAEQMLTLCELAKKRNMDKLTDDEIKEINEAIQTLEETALNSYGMSLNTFIKMVYGAGVTVKDITKVMEYQTIAGNFYEVIEDELKAKIGEDRVNAYFDENKLDFLNVDYLNFSFSATKGKTSTTNTAEQNQKIEDDYKADKEAVDKFHNKFKEVKTADEFKAILVEYFFEVLVDDEFESEFEEAFEDLDKGLLPSTDEKNEFKTATLEKLKEELLKLEITYKTETEEEEDKKDESKEEDKKDQTEEEKKAEKVEKAKKEVYDSLLDTFTTKFNSVFTEKGTYTKDDEVSEWLYADATKENDLKTSTKNSDKDAATESYTANVVMLIKKPNKNEELTKNVGHILFTKAKHGDDFAEDAKKLLEEFKKGEMTKDAFEKLGLENTADSGVFYDNVKKGDMVKEFENWLFDESRKEGDTGIVTTTYGDHVMYFVGTDNAVWYNNVFDTIYGEDYEKWFEDAKVEAGVSVNKKNLNKIEA